MGCLVGTARHMNFQAITSCWANAGLMLVHRQRRWNNIKPALVQHPSFAGLCLDETIGQHGALGQSWPNVSRAGRSGRIRSLHSQYEPILYSQQPIWMTQKTKSLQCHQAMRTLPSTTSSTSTSRAQKTIPDNSTGVGVNRGRKNKIIFLSTCRWSVGKSQNWK